MKATLVAGMNRPTLPIKSEPKPNISKQLSLEERKSDNQLLQHLKIWGIKILDEEILISVMARKGSVLFFEGPTEERTPNGLRTPPCPFSHIHTPLNTRGLSYYTYTPHACSSAWASNPLHKYSPIPSSIFITTSTNISSLASAVHSHYFSSLAS